MSPKPTALTAPRKIGGVLVSVHDTEPVTAPEPGAPDNGPAVAPIEGPTSTPSYTPMVAGNLGDVYLRATQATTQAGTDELAGLRPDESSTAPNEPSLASHVGGVLTEAAQKVPERFFAGTKQAADAILPTDPNDPRSGLRRTWDAVTGVLEASFPFSAAAGHISGAVAEAVVRKNGSMTDEALKARRAEYVAAQQAGGTGVDGVDYSEFIASVDNLLKMPYDARLSQARQTAEVAGELVAGFVPGYTGVAKGITKLAGSASVAKGAASVVRGAEDVALTAQRAAERTAVTTKVETILTEQPDIVAALTERLAQAKSSFQEGATKAEAGVKKIENLVTDNQPWVQGAKEVVTEAGANYIGAVDEAGTRAVWFRDPVTESSHLLSVDELSKHRVMDEMSASRSEFAKASATAAVANDSTMPTTVAALARAVVGGAVGGSVGETTEDRVKNALVGAGLAAAASPKLIRALAGEIRSIDLTSEVGAFKPLPSGEGRAAVRKLTPEAAAEGQSAVKAGMRSFAVDWKAIDSPAAVDRAVNDLVQKADVFLTARTGEAPSAQVRALIADAVGVDEKALLANPRMAIREKEINATAMLADEARSQLVQLNAQFLAHSADAPGKAVLATELDHQIQRTAMVFEKLYQYREEAGLALRTFGTEAKGAVQSAEKTRQLIEELRSSGLPLDRFSSLLAALPEPVQQAGFLRRVFSGGASGLDYLAEYFIQGLLTSPFGHAANIAANAVQYGMAVGAQAIVNPSRAYYMLVGAAHSFPEALEAWWNTVKTGVSPFGESKVGLGQAKSKGFAGLAERLSAGAGPDDWATHFLARTLNGMTLPSRTISAEDSFAKIINKRSFLWTEAVTEASERVKTGSLQQGDVAGFIRGFVDNPPPRVEILAEDFANTNTFNQALTGKLQSLGNGLSHPLVRFVLPFYRIGVNITRSVAEYTPVLGMAVQRQREMFAAGGASRSLVLGQWGVGGSMWATAGYLTSVGVLRGKGPSNANLLREWQKDGDAMSAKVGDQWVPLRYFGVPGLMMGAAATVAEMFEEVAPDDFNEFATIFAVASAQSVLNQTFLQGTKDFLDTVMLKGPEEGYRIDKLAQNVVGSLAVPQLAYVAARIADPIARETYNALDKILSRTPGYDGAPYPNSTSLYPRIGLDGTEQPGRGLLYSKDRSDVVSRELLRQKISISLPSVAIDGPKPPMIGQATEQHGIPLDAEQIYRFRKLAGNSLKLRGEYVAKITMPGLEFPARPLGLWDALTVLVQSPMYQEWAKKSPGPDGTAARMIHAVVDGYHEAAQTVLIWGVPHQLEKFITSDDPELLKGDAELQQQWREKTLDRAGATGVAIPRAELATHLDRIISSLGR